MLKRISIPALLVTGTDTGVGKTIITCAIAAALRRAGLRVGVLKPVATGCIKAREGLVSEDAELLAHHADSPHPLDIICPQRYLEPLAPAVAAERAQQPVDWAAVQRSIDIISPTSDVLLVEGVGGIMVPLDNRHTVLDLAQWMSAPAVIVARPNLGTINHTLLTARALRSVEVSVAGVVINRYPPDSTPVAEETNPRAIERWGKVPVLGIVPETTERMDRALPTDVLSPIERVDWLGIATART
ncbi:MAG TPA: dethiobiotin synthase [Tepidisphaeraceae bacterium]|jgi:dethiobiotin synthetase